jgi:tRNA threonylcarbamoyladenosine biosynthesis protein TsaB
VAQGLGLGTGLPLVPVGTLEALAQAARRVHGVANVVACLDARMREIYVAAYAHEGGRWREVVTPTVLAPAAVALPAGPWFGAGGGFAAYPDLVRQLELAGVDAAAMPDARAIGELAQPRLGAGEGVAAGDALPVYVRHRVALTVAERAAGARL